MVNTVNVLAELLYFVYTTYYRYIYRIVHKIGPSMLVHVYVYEVTTSTIIYTTVLYRCTWFFLYKQLHRLFGQINEEGSKIILPEFRM
jgi:hypothetical protein